jgi:hypothetical protein
MAVIFNNEERRWYMRLRINGETLWSPVGEPLPEPTEQVSPHENENPDQLELWDAETTRGWVQSRIEKHFGQVARDELKPFLRRRRRAAKNSMRG